MSFGKLPTPALEPRRRTEAAARRERHILLAEDDSALRSLLASALTRDGYHVVQATDGTKVLDILASHLMADTGSPPFDLIVSDVRMPGWSGLDVLAGLRRLPGAPPVVLITGFGDDDFRAHARRLGAAATLDKPFDIDELRNVIRGIVAPPT